MPGGETRRTQNPQANPDRLGVFQEGLSPLGRFK